MSQVGVLSKHPNRSSVFVVNDKRDDDDSSNVVSVSPIAAAKRHEI